MTQKVKNWRDMRVVCKCGRKATWDEILMSRTAAGDIDRLFEGKLAVVHLRTRCPGCEAMGQISLQTQDYPSFTIE